MGVEGEQVDQREFGELIAGVRHLAEMVGKIDVRITQDTAKLHARLDSVLGQMATREEVQELRSRVDALSSHPVDGTNLYGKGMIAGISLVSAILGAVATYVAALL